MKYVVDQTYENQDWDSEKFPLGEYENCRFVNIRMYDANLNSYEFTDCTFENCDLSLISVVKTAFKNVNFDSCKMLDILFEKSSHFAFKTSFRNCILDNSSFYNKDIKRTLFADCSLMDVDFSESNLSDAHFLNCNLHRAVFHQTKLTNTDFSTAKNYQFDLSVNFPKNTIFSQQGLEGLLTHFSIKII